MQQGLCDLRVQVNGHHAFFVNKDTLCAYSGMMRKLVRQGRRPPSQSKPHANPPSIKIADLPGGPDGFELVARFCYSGAGVPALAPSNIALLHTSATFMEMTEDMSPGNLLAQAEACLDGLFCWTWNDVLAALKGCERVYTAAHSCGLLHRLVAALLVKISATNTHVPFSVPSSSCSSSPDTSGPGSARPWWFHDLTLLCPATVEHILRTLGAYGNHNTNLTLTRFLLHYLKTAVRPPPAHSATSYAALADTAVHGVVLIGRSAFTCRMLFSVMRLVSGMGLTRDCRTSLETLIALSLHQATLDDLLVSGRDGDIYDVDLVLRLVRLFVNAQQGGLPPLPRMNKVATLIDKYMREISPDHTLKLAKFIALAESLPDSARDSSDGLYRAIDIYIESHPTLTPEDRSRLCRCLNYDKLTLEVCKDLAKNPRIPPRVTVQALICQQSKIHHYMDAPPENTRTATNSPKTATLHRYREKKMFSPSSGFPHDTSLSFKMQGRVVELDKVYREQIKGQQMDTTNNKSSIGATPLHPLARGLPRLC